MDTTVGLRHMKLTYESKCGNPDCERGKLPAGSSVVINNKRIYCGSECADAHQAAGPRRAARKTAVSKTAVSKTGGGETAARKTTPRKTAARKSAA